MESLRTTQKRYAEEQEAAIKARCGMQINEAKVTRVKVANRIVEHAEETLARLHKITDRAEQQLAVVSSTPSVRPEEIETDYGHYPALFGELESRLRSMDALCDRLSDQLDRLEV